MANLEVGDIVMCTVERIAGTLVFVKIDGNGQGTIILSEIAPGRIRNLREYVIPKKRIICKILRMTQDRIDLSLRRVTPKEQKEIKEQYKSEKSYMSVLKTILKDKANKIIEEIQNKEKIYEFLEEAKVNPIHLEKLVGKSDAQKILDILNTQKQKEVFLKKEFKLNSTKSNGISLIKEILEKIKDVEIKYLSAGKYFVKTSATSLKQADILLTKTLQIIEKQAKKQDMEFSIKDK